MLNTLNTDTKIQTGINIIYKKGQRCVANAPQLDSTETIIKAKY